MPTLTDYEEIRAVKIKELELRREKQRRTCEKNFFEFVRASFPVITQDTEWADNWHYEVLCNGKPDVFVGLQSTVQRVIDGQPNLYDLFINLPPRTLKSKIVAVCLNAWVWIHRPSISFFVCSRNIELCNQHASYTRTLIESAWYQRNWGNVYRLNSDAECSYGNDKGGERWKVAPCSTKGVGFGCSIMIYDDIDDPEQVHREVERNRVLGLVNEKMSRSRFNDPKTGARIFLQQRCHTDDSSGWHYKNQVYPMKKLVLPAEDSAQVYPTELRKSYVDGLLFPARLGPDVLSAQKRILRNSYSAQYGQNPIATAGNMFNPTWARWYTPAQRPQFSRIGVFADTANTNQATSCPVSIQVWGQAGPNFYLVQDETAIMSIKSTEKRIMFYANMLPGCYIVVENASSGFSILETLKLYYGQVFGFNPGSYGGKEKRAESIAGYWEGGNVFLPDLRTTREPKTDLERKAENHMHAEYLPEITAFPEGQFRDRVDCMSMALIFFSRGAHAAGSGAQPQSFPGQF